MTLVECMREKRNLQNEDLFFKRSPRKPSEWRSLLQEASLMSKHNNWPRQVVQKRWLHTTCQFSARERWSSPWRSVIEQSDLPGSLLCCRIRHGFAWMSEEMQGRNKTWGWKKRLLGEYNLHKRHFHKILWRPQIAKFCVDDRLTARVEALSVYISFTSRSSMRSLRIMAVTSFTKMSIPSADRQTRDTLFWLMTQNFTQGVI